MNRPPSIDALRLPGWVCCGFSRDRMTTRCGGEIADPETRFPLASVTKTFTAHLCLQPGCRELLDRPIREVMPYFQLRDPAAAREMTPRDALCHFSGLAPHTEDWVRCELSRQDYIRQRLPLLPSAGPFREKHRYSNLMYAVLGQWLEEITGHSWERLVTDRILGPLDMTRTGLLDEHWADGTPAPHALDADGKLRRIPPFYARTEHLIAPASEMIGSMPDLARWGRSMLRLDPEDERWRPHNRISEDEATTYGLGWRLDTVRDGPRVWHSGQCSGYSSLLILHPRRGRGWALATNRGAAVDELMALHAKF